MKFLKVLLVVILYFLYGIIFLAKYQCRKESASDSLKDIMHQDVS